MFNMPIEFNYKMTFVSQAWINTLKHEFILTSWGAILPKLGTNLIHGNNLFNITLTLIALD